MAELALAHGVVHLTQGKGETVGRHGTVLLLHVRVGLADGQGVQPEPTCVLAQAVRRLDELLENGVELALVALLGSYRGAHRCDDRTFAVQKVHGVVSLGFEALLLHVLAARVGRLPTAKALVVSHEHVVLARTLDLGGVGTANHLLGIACVGHLEADLELRVCLNLIVDDASWTLCGQDEVHAQRATDTRRGDELVHEFGFLLLELCELVGNDKEVRQRLLEHALTVVRDVLVDVHRGLARDIAGLVEHVLTTLKLRLNGDQGTLDGAAVEVGDGARQVRQVVALVLEGAGKATALIVNEHEGRLVRCVVHAHRQDVGDDELGLA